MYPYGGPPKASVNRATLPTAPRSSLGADVDLTRVPTKPPFTAFLGNLPFDVEEDEIERFFGKLAVSGGKTPLFKVSTFKQYCVFESDLKEKR